MVFLRKMLQHAMTTTNCRICNERLMPGLTFREMMFGLREEFAYGQCANCESIQILEVPADIEKYYPPYYYSFNETVPQLKKVSVFKRIIGNYRIGKKYKKGKNHELEYLRPLNTMPDAKILDIGCGKGVLICKLYNFGFEHVEGVDKYIPTEWNYNNVVQVHKKDLSELPTASYDVLMMHHVLEHMDEQVKELNECYRLLKKGGTLLIRIPVLGDAWERYKNNWVQLDAPRHFVLHSLKSIDILAQKTGFKISKTVFDSHAFQFWGSELYKKDIPLTIPETHAMRIVTDEFTVEELLKFTEDANCLNTAKKGDQAIFYLYKE
jgi:SAM-dependent methyltransferase